MKKFFFLNLIFILILLVFFDISLFYLDTKKYISFDSCNQFFKYYFSYYSRNVDKDFLINRYIYNNDSFVNYRRVVNPESKLEPILLFGCSFTYGHKIPIDKIASEEIGKYTFRPVYNRSYHGAGPQLMLFQLENNDFYNIIPKPEYIIYTFVSDHFRRLSLPCVTSIESYYDIFYKEKNGFLTLKKSIKLPFFVYFIKNKFYKITDKDVQFFKIHILTSKQLIDKKWSNSEFILFVYNQNDVDYIKSIENDLIENGINVVYRKDIAPYHDFDVKYSLAKDDCHPNLFAWEYITPKLVKSIQK